MSTLELLVLLLIVGAASISIGFYIGGLTSQDEITDRVEKYVREKEKERKDKGGEEDGSK